MLRTKRAYRDELTTGRYGRGLFEVYDRVDFFGDHIYYLFDEEVRDEEPCGSSLIFDLKAAAGRIASDPNSALYALLPQQVTGLRRRVLSAVTSIWVCAPANGVMGKATFWRVQTDQLTYLVDNGDIALGQEVPRTLVWAENQT